MQLIYSVRALQVTNALYEVYDDDGVSRTSCDCSFSLENGNRLRFAPYFGLSRRSLFVKSTSCLMFWLSPLNLGFVAEPQRDR